MKGKMLGIGLLLVFTAYGYAEISKRGLLGPAVSTTSANNHITGGQDVVYAAGASGVRNCLDSVDAIATSAYILRVLDGGTTIYQLTLGANVGVVRSWDQDEALCGTAATALRVKVTTTSAGTYDLNTKGFTY